MSNNEGKVLAEYERFKARLPELMETSAGKWVVFRDDQVQSVHDSHDAALMSAIESFGLSGGYVIAPVAEVKPTPLTAAVMFGHRAL
jgi:hypothetical protein